jgi:prolyl oligopeptidase
MKNLYYLLFILLMTVACSKTPNPDTISQYPASAKVDTVDTYFGTEVADPYRWMENDTTKAVADWVKAENEVTFGFLDKIPYRAEIKKLDW